MTAAEFKQELKKLKGGYLFFGEEDYLKTRYLVSARTELFPDGNDYFDFVSLSADNYTPTKLSDEIMSPPVMNEKKLIVLRDMRFEEFRDGDVTDFNECLERISSSEYVVTVVFLSASESAYIKEKKQSLFKTMSKALVPVEFPHEEPQRLAKWVARHFSDNGVFADTELCAKLISQCGPDMFTLKNEADKLSSYVLSKSRDRLLSEDITDAGVTNLEIGAFDFANAILKRDRKLAFAILARYKLSKYPPELILSGISKTICDIYSVKLLIGEGDRSETVASKLGIHPYKAKIYCQAAQPCDTERLAYLIKVCENADSLVKSSGLNNYTVLDGLAAEALSR